VGRYLSAKLANSLRKAGTSPPYPGTAFAREVYEKCNGCSVLSETENDVRNLFIVRIDPNGPWSPENAVLVTSDEARALAICKRYPMRTLPRCEQK
jgi:hypothetical protein